MKFLIACLGNIGSEYENTRHNIGFKIADKIAADAKVSFNDKRCGSVAEVKYKGRTLIALKPSTYMNLSGHAVNYWLQKEKISDESLLVVADDINLPFGTIRIKGKGSDGGHNGLKDIIQMFGHQNYARLRFGVGNEFSKGTQVDYVLGEWSDDEEKLLPERIEKAAEAIKSFTTIGLERTMNFFNTKK